MLCKVDVFKGFSTKLDSLSNETKQAIDELIFSYREGVLSVAIVTRDLPTFEKLVGFKIHPQIAEKRPNRYFVDLESIHSNKTRLYVDSPYESDITLHGYYADSSGYIYEKKIYKKDKNNECRLLIDRYDASGALMSADEPEIQCNRRDWKGPAKLIKLASTAACETVFMKKEHKDQCYLRVIGLSQSVENV